MSPKAKRISDTIQHSDRMLLFMREYLTSADGKENSEMMNNRAYHVNKEPITYRQLNHWEESGLLPPREDAGWRRYGMIEALWVHIIYELRSTFEVRLDGLKNVMDCLRAGNSKVKTFMPVFEMYVHEALFRRKQVYLIIFEDKSAIPADVEMLNSISKRKDIGHFLVLDINKLLKKIVPKYEWALNPDN